MSRAKRILCGALLASGLFATGCFVLPVSYPKLSYLPGVEAGAALSDCFIVRMDCSVYQTENHGDYGEYTLTEVLPDPDGRIPSHASMSLEKKNVFVGFHEGYQIVGKTHRTLLRLYRPGYALVELGSWHSTDQVQWQRAKDWSDQERAIDGLLDGPPATYAGARLLWDQEGKTFHHLPKLTNNSANAVRPFVFAAAEYERVAALAPTPEGAARLRDKARRLVEVKAAAGSTPGFP